jgi:3-hydroxyisobutyrate dehydrogenase-like beta-hydroxyacid dehydrogenase
MVGLGIMGSAMAANLMRHGYRVLGYDVLARARRRHRDAGGEVATAAEGLASRCDIVVCSLPSSAALLATAAALGRAAPGTQIVVETSTLPLAVKHEAHGILAERGVTLLDCPISGTGVQARARDVVVYASGERRAYRRIVPVLEALARAHYYVGPFGAGSKIKFVANLLVAVHNVAAAEALVLAMKAGLDPALVVKVVGEGAGSSRMFQIRAPMMAAGRYTDASMKLDVWQKDMTIIGDFARELNCPTPLFAAVAPIYTAALAMGRQREDTAAVCAVLEQMAGVQRRLKRSNTEVESKKVRQRPRISYEAP